MSDNHDLSPAAHELARLADGVHEDQLGLATPCTDWNVAVLLDHILALASAFTAAAAKTSVEGDEPPSPTGELPVDWRERLHHRLDALTEAWRASEAWEGETMAGGITMPAEIAGVVALDELVLHGWDLARATGQPFHADPDSVQASLTFVAAMSEPGQDREGLYGPVVVPPDDASEFERLLGLSGRSPRGTRT